MKKKLSALIVSFALIAVCVSLIAGATFALFSSESGVNIAVTSAKVNVVASIDSDSYQTKQLGEEYADGLDNTCAAGGVAIDANGVLQISKFAPGDGVKFNIEIVNNSNVDVKYRATYGAVNHGLLNALDISVSNTAHVWQTWAASEDKVKVITVCVEFPENDSNNNYNSSVEKSCELKFKVEVVQGNAETADPATHAEATQVLKELNGADAKLNLAGNYEQLEVQVLTANSTVTKEDVASNGWPHLYRTKEIGVLEIDGANAATVNGLRICNGYSVSYAETSSEGLNKYQTDTIIIDTLKITNLTITGRVQLGDIKVENKSTLKIGKLIFDNVTFDFGGQSLDSGLNLVSNSGDTFGDVIISNCSFIGTENVNKPIGLDFRCETGLNLTVENCYFESAKYNAIQLGGAGSYYAGEIKINNNVIVNSVERGIRLSGLKGNVSICNNTLVNAVDADGEGIKAGIVSGSTVVYTGNSINGIAQENLNNKSTSSNIIIALP